VVTDDGSILVADVMKEQHREDVNTLKEARKELTCLRKDNNVLAEHVRTHQIEISGLNAQLQQKEKEISQLSAQHTEEMAAHERSSREQIDKLALQVENLSKKVTEVQTQLTLKETLLDSLNKRLEMEDKLLLRLTEKNTKSN
jgi:predicted RNase H-like nuclease (RuvC/YqgF family)